MAPAPGARHSFTWFTGFTWLLSEGLSEEWPKYSIRFFFLKYNNIHSDNAWGCNVRGSPVGTCENLEVTGAHDCWEMLGSVTSLEPNEFPKKQQDLGGPCSPCSAALQLWLEHDAASRCQEAWSGLCFSPGVQNGKRSQGTSRIH